MTEPRTIDRFTSKALVAMAAAYGLPAEGLSDYGAAHPGSSAGEQRPVTTPSGLSSRRIAPRWRR